MAFRGVVEIVVLEPYRPADGRASSLARPLRAAYLFLNGRNWPVVLSDFLSARRVKVPLESSERDAVLRELVALVARAEGLEAEAEEIYRAVQAREEVLSTGIGDGIALPHAKSEHLPDLVVAAGVSRVPVDFDALDSQPVRLFFLLLAPERALGLHIKALSRISRLLRQESLRQRLVAAADANEFVRILQEAEAAALSNRA